MTDTDIDKNTQIIVHWPRADGTGDVHIMIANLIGRGVRGYNDADDAADRIAGDDDGYELYDDWRNAVARYQEAAEQAVADAIEERLHAAGYDLVDVVDVSMEATERAAGHITEPAAYVSDVFPDAYADAWEALDAEQIAGAEEVRSLARRLLAP